MSAARSIFIPVQNSAEEVQVFVENLPDHNDVLDVLKAEQAPLDLWLAFAREYFKQGKIAEFLEFLTEGSSPEVEEFYSDIKYERIAILNALGSYYTNLGRTRQRQRDEFFIKAVDFYNKASRVSAEEVSTWVGKGQLQLLKGDLSQAEEMFRIALSDQPQYVPAMLGQACVLFNRGKFQDALNLYKRVLQIHPRCPAPVRLGIGLCHFRLQGTNPKQQAFHAAKAREAFDRVLQLDEDNVDALVAAALLDFQSSEDVEAMERGMQRMKRAFEVYPFTPMALNHLANHFFFTGDHHVVQQLMDTAVACTSHPLIRAESLFNLARSFHAKGHVEKALSFYKAATDAVSPAEFVLPFYGLAQLQVRVGDLKSAMGSVNAVLKVNPSDPDSLKLLGSILLQQGSRDEALASFKRVVDLYPSDAQALLELGELQIETDAPAALKSFLRAQEVLKNSKQEVPWQLLNNIAVLQQQLKEHESAISLFCEALGSKGPWQAILSGPSDGSSDEAGEKMNEGSNGEAAKDGSNGADGVGRGPEEADPTAAAAAAEGAEALDVERVTTVFNLALLLEQQSEGGKAERIHELILKQFPDYVDSYLRLASMAKQRCDWSTCQHWLGEVLSREGSSVDALLLQHEVEMAADDMGRAKETLKKILEIDGKNSAALVGLGNWNLLMAQRSFKDQKIESSFLEKAKEHFQKALQIQPSNMFAANGLGCVMGERGDFESAKAVFAQVQEAATANGSVDMPQVWINLANSHLANSDFSLALKLYEKSLSRFHFNTHSPSLLYVSRVHYEAAQLQQCRASLLKALHAAPSNSLLRFNAAVAMQKLAVTTLKLEKRSAGEVRMVVHELRAALRVFSQLASLGSSSAGRAHGSGFDTKKTETHVEYCQHLLSAAKQHLEAAEREEQQRKQKLEVARQQALAEDARKRAEDERKLQEERRRRDEEERSERMREEEFRRRMESWKRAGKQAEDEEEGGAGDGDGDRDQRRKKKKRKRKAVEEEVEEQVIFDDELEEGEAEKRVRDYPVANDDADADDDNEVEKSRADFHEDGGGDGGGGKGGVQKALAAAGLLDDESD